MNHTKPEAVIFDLDGTLCDTSGIVHFVNGPKKDHDAFHRASASCPPNEHVVEMLRPHLEVKDRQVFIVTGRDEKHRALSESWLGSNGIPWDVLLMRPRGDMRQDTVVKAEILEQIRRKLDVIAAYDDRPTVLAMWREQGIPTVVDVQTWKGPVL